MTASRILAGLVPAVLLVCHCHTDSNGQPPAPRTTYEPAAGGPGRRECRTNGDGLLTAEEVRRRLDE